MEVVNFFFDLFFCDYGDSNDVLNNELEMIAGDMECTCRSPSSVKSVYLIVAAFWHEMSKRNDFEKSTCQLVGDG